MAAGSLDGVTCVVTGATRGIGYAIARLLVDRGARVALVARHSGRLHDAEAALGSAAIPIACDVGSAAEVAAAVTRIDQSLGGAPHVVVNNAGAFTLTPIDRVDPAEFESVVATNLVAPMRFVRAFLPAMRARGSGHIVTIGSIADRNAFPGNAAYAASKFGLRALHEVLRTETRGSGVRASLISPGPVDTPLWDAVDPDHQDGLTPRTAMLDADAVARAVIYVVTEAASVNIDELRLSRS